MERQKALRAHLWECFYAHLADKSDLDAEAGYKAALADLRALREEYAGLIYREGAGEGHAVGVAAAYLRHHLPYL